MTPWRRQPPVESARIYPGLVVHDQRVTGSITVGPTRLPVWAFVGDLITPEAWDQIQDSYEPSMSREDFTHFLGCLLEARGEFARLLLELADAERSERERGITAPPWWQVPTRRRRVTRQLQRCIDCMTTKETT